MAASARNLPLRERRIERIGFRATEDESILIRRAAELRGWTVTRYVMCAVLDRAERDLHEHAARTRLSAADPAAAAESLDVLANIFTA